jgi:DnaK suppressor protein
MNDKTSGSEQAFLDRQHARLLKLHAEISRTIEAEEAEESEVQQQSLGAAQEAEDDAQRLSLLDVEGTIVRQNMERLPMIERALAKIEDGTYGFSDSSGKPIPRERLEAMPEAINTADEDAKAASVR